MDATLSTTHKLRNLLRTTNLNVTRFSAICREHGLTKGFSDPSINRALQLGRFPSQKMDDEIRVIVLRMEKLVAFMQPFRVSFEDADQVHTMLEILSGCNVALQIEPKEISVEE